MSQILKVPTHPSDCLLGIALPMTEQELREDLTNTAGRDFARFQLQQWKLANASELWHKTPYGAFMGRFGQMLEEIKGMGVSVIPNFRLTDLGNVPKFKAFTLLTHWVESASKVELQDGLFTPEEFANAVPSGCHSIFDLTVCNSIHLQTSIKRHHPACIVIANERPADLQFRAVFYKSLVKVLAAKPINYVEAFTGLRLMLAK